ncbi:MAG: hypothetical protein ACOYKD_04320 [Anaerolineaceae bacterium]
MADKQKLKETLGNLPMASEIWWEIRGKYKPWSSHFTLEGLREVLPGAVVDVRQLAKPCQQAKKVLVFASLHYWIEQAALIALALSGQGHRVSLGYLPYSDWEKPITSFDLKRQDAYARDVFKPAKQVMGIVPLLKRAARIDSLKPLPAGIHRIVEKTSRYDTMYTRQIEEVPEGDPLYALRLERNSLAAVLVDTWFEKEKPDVVIVPNGTILEMGVAYQIARLRGIRTVTFEFADQRERIWLAQDGEIMSHDTTALWQALGNQPLPEKAKQKLVDLYAARKNAKSWGEFARQWQINPQQGAEEVKKSLSLDERPVALLATNVLGDSLTLGREKISPTMADWIVRTIEWFTSNPKVQLVVRIHPGELLTHGTSMSEVIAAAFPILPENIHILQPGDKVNTYDLIEIADFGLVYTTTVGLEMAMDGIPVIVAGKTHYATRGFTFDPKDWPDYIKQLSQVAASPQNFRLSEQRIEQAWLYAYLFFFEFSLPFPWHILWLKDDFKTRPIRFVLNIQGQNRYAKTFGYLVGKPLDWADRGLARLNERVEEAKS